jgi:hypothetical protein
MESANMGADLPASMASTGADTIEEAVAREVCSLPLFV